MLASTAWPTKTFATLVRNELRTISQGDRLLVIGPSRDAQLLEIVVLDPDGDPVAIHAMPLRAKFFDFLR